MTPEETAKRFWRGRYYYPPYGTIKLRRRQEVATLMPMIDGSRSTTSCCPATSVN